MSSQWLADRGQVVTGMATALVRTVMQRRTSTALWPRRDFPAPRGFSRILFGLLVALAGATLVGGVLLAGVAYFFLRFPQYAAHPDWSGGLSIREGINLLLQEPLGWLVVILALVIGVLLFVVIALSTDGVILLPDRIVVRQGTREQAARYWEIDRIWLKRGPEGERWLVLEGAFIQPVELPLSGEHPLSTSTLRALPHMLQRVPTWTRVSPEVKRLAEETPR